MIRYIHPVFPGVAQGVVDEIYAQIKRDFGRVVEPFVLHSPLPTLLAGGWMVCREAELVGTVSRNVKEAVAAAVSMLNRCPYCVDAHTIMLASTGDYAVADAISSSCYWRIGDAKLRSIVDWALATGMPGRGGDGSPPFSPEEAPEIIGTAVFYHYISRLATVLLGATPLPSSRSWLRSPLKHVAGLMFRGAVQRPKNAGESLRFLPDAAGSKEPEWAKANPFVAQAFARFAEAIEEAGESALPSDVRGLVSGFVGKWSGETLGIGNYWVEVETRKLEEASKSAAQLALLAALAPHQIDEEIILRFRRHFAEDYFLLGALAWASFKAAQKIGGWIQPKWI